MRPDLTERASGLFRRYQIVILATLIWSLSMHWWEGELMWRSHSPAFEPLRIMAVVDAWRHGIWDARWTPLLDRGYGYPIFSYHAPLFSWIGGVLLVLTGKPVLALKLAIMLFFVIGGLGCRTMAASFWARPGMRDWAAGDLAFAGWASAAYLFTNIFVRGSLAEFAAGAFFPWLLWGMWLIAAGGGARFAAGAGVIAVSLALMVLSHNAVAIYAILLVAVALPVLFRPAGSRGWAAWAAGGAMAACLSAFFALPLMLEMEYVRLHHVTFTNFNDHFLRFHNLFSLTAWNPGFSGQAASSTMPRHQGFLLPFALAGGAIAFRLFQARCLRRKTLSILALNALTLAMTAAPSVWLWEHIPLLNFTQFPWRWLSLSATALALLMPALGLAIRLHASELARHTYTVAAGAVLLLNVGLFGGPGPEWQRWNFDPNPELVRAANSRTASDDEYGPVWRHTDFSHPVPAGGALAENVRAAPATNHAFPWRWRVDTRHQDTDVTLGVHYFPGWRAYWRPEGGVAAARIPLAYSKTGLILVRLPPGSSGYLELKFTNMRIRWALKVFSGASALVLVALAIWIRRRKPTHPVSEVRF